MHDDRPHVGDLGHELDDEFMDESPTVRPYTLTRGRTRPGTVDLPLEALVRGVAPAGVPPTGVSAGVPPTGVSAGVPAAGGAGDTPERRRILELTGAEILSVAELSAHLSLPLGVVRVLVGDLADDGLVVVHSGTPQSQAPAASQLKVLESVLNGISSL